MKGNPDKEELVDAQRASKKCGLTLEEKRTFSLPSDSGDRTIFTYKKTHEATVKLPRRIGIAKINRCR